MSISVKNVKKFYGSQAALNNVSFELEKGEVVGFLGPNGAGKSTMMKIITCYLPPSEGMVEVAGYDIFNHDITVRKHVGYLPENNALYPEMYIREYLHYVAGLYHVKNAKDRVAEMIEMVGLQKEAHKQIGQLSKGYRQRVGLAQALIHDPDVLILDEPTTGLDPNQLEEIRGLIKTLGKNKTVLISTHIMQEVEAMCSRVIIIKSGEIVADSPVPEMIQKLGSDALVIRVSSSLPIDKLKALPGVASAELLAAGTYRVKGDDHAQLKAAINNLARAHKTDIEELRLETRSLESIFKELTK